jgi:hypothetical protein
MAGEIYIADKATLDLVKADTTNIKSKVDLIGVSSKLSNEIFPIGNLPIEGGTWFRAGNYIIYYNHTVYQFTVYDSDFNVKMGGAIALGIGTVFSIYDLGDNRIIFVGNSSTWNFRVIDLNTLTLGSGFTSNLLVSDYPTLDGGAWANNEFMIAVYNTKKQAIIGYNIVGSTVSFKRNIYVNASVQDVMFPQSIAYKSPYYYVFSAASMHVTSDLPTLFSSKYATYIKRTPGYSTVLQATRSIYAAIVPAIAEGDKIYMMGTGDLSNPASSGIPIVYNTTTDKFIQDKFIASLPRYSAKASALNSRGTSISYKGKLYHVGVWIDRIEIMSSSTATTIINIPRIVITTEDAQGNVRYFKFKNNDDFVFKLIISMFLFIVFE